MPGEIKDIKGPNKLVAYQISAQKAAAIDSKAAYWQSFAVGLQFKPSLTLAEHEAVVNSYLA